MVRNSSLSAFQIMAAVASTPWWGSPCPERLRGLRGHTVGAPASGTSLWIERVSTWISHSGPSNLTKWRRKRGPRDGRKSRQTPHHAQPMVSKEHMDQMLNSPSPGVTRTASQELKWSWTSQSCSMPVCLDIDCNPWQQAVMQKEHYSKAGLTVLHTYLASAQWSDLYPACQHLQSNKQMYWRTARENTTLWARLYSIF